MTTRNFIVDTNKYTLVSETDCIVQNLSPYPIRVVFSNYYPSADTQDYRIVEPKNTKKGTQEHTISKFLDTPSGDVYVMCGGSSDFDRKSDISVTTGGGGLNENISLEILLSNIFSEIKHLRVITQETFDSDITKEDIEDC